MIEGRLAELLDELFMNEPELMIVSNEHGTYGVALVLDGWYADRGPNDSGISAEDVLPWWRELLRDTVAIAEEASND